MKSSETGTVEIKKCGFNTRPKLMAPGGEGGDESIVDVLPELFRKYEGKQVRVTVETMPAKPPKARGRKE